MQPNFHCPYEDCQAKAVIYTGGDYICTECNRPIVCIVCAGRNAVNPKSQLCLDCVSMEVGVCD
jgi:hypothetical protein